MLSDGPHDAYADPRRRAATPEEIAAVLAMPVSSDPQILRQLVTGVVLQAVQDLAGWSRCWQERERLSPETVLDSYLAAVLADAWLTADDSDPDGRLTVAECAAALDIDPDRMRTLTYERCDQQALDILWQGERSAAVQELRDAVTRHQTERKRRRLQRKAAETSTTRPKTTTPSDPETMPCPTVPSPARPSPQAASTTTAADAAAA